MERSRTAANSIKKKLAAPKTKEENDRIRRVLQDEVPPRRLTCTRNPDELISVLDHQDADLDDILNKINDILVGSDEEEDKEAKKDDVVDQAEGATSNPKHHQRPSGTKSCREELLSSERCHEGERGSGQQSCQTQNSLEDGAWTDKQKAAIYKLVATEIGRNWREFGRGLNIKQGELDDIEEQFPKNVMPRVYKMFMLFEEFGRIDPRKRIYTIIKALEDSRRKDLARKVQELLTY